MKRKLLVLLTLCASFMGCASSEKVSTQIPKPLKNTPKVKLGFLHGEFSTARQEDNYDKQYNDDGQNVKFYWVAEPKWEPNAPERNRPETMSSNDQEYAKNFPWVQSRSTTNYPVIGIQKRTRAQKFFGMSLKTWDVCFLSRLNLTQSTTAKERYLSSELEGQEAFSRKATAPTPVSCDGFERIKDMSRKLEK
ncbi:MAG: hypothetical protein AB7K41_09885 [Bdellovibrionales bacterium]